MTHSRLYEHFVLIVKLFLMIILHGSYMSMVITNSNIYHKLAYYVAETDNFFNQHVTFNTWERLPNQTGNNCSYRERSHWRLMSDIPHTWTYLDFCSPSNDSYVNLTTPDGWYIRAYKNITIIFHNIKF